MIDVLGHFLNLLLTPTFDLDRTFLLHTFARVSRQFRTGSRGLTSHLPYALSVNSTPFGAQRFSLSFTRKKEGQNVCDE